MHGKAFISAAKLLATRMALGDLPRLRWDFLSSTGSPDSNLWKGQVQLPGRVQVYPLKGKEFGVVLEQLRRSYTSPWLFPGVTDADPVPEWAFRRIMGTIPEPSDIAIRFILVYERYLHGLPRGGAYRAASDQALRVLPKIANGLNLDPEVLVTSRDPEDHILAEFLHQGLGGPTKVVDVSDAEFPATRESRMAEPSAFAKPPPRKLEKFAPPRSNPSTETVVLADPLPAPVRGPLRFGQLRSLTDAFLEHAAIALRSEITRGQLVALTEALLAGDANVVVTQSELSARETQVALRAEQLVRAVPSGPFDLIELVWAHLRLWGSDKHGLDLPPWPQRALPDAIRDDRDLALCLWATFGPRRATYLQLPEIKRKNVRGPSRGSAKIGQGRTNLLTIRGAMALRSLERLLQWSGDLDPRVYAARPLLPIRAGSTEALPGDAIVSLLLDNGFPLTGDAA